MQHCLVNSPHNLLRDWWWHDAFMIWEKQQQLLDLLGWEVTSISRDFYTICEWQLLRFCGKLWVLTYCLSFFLQLLRQFRSDRCSRLPAHRAGHSANSSEDHRDCRNPLHLQEPALQVRLIGVLFMHLEGTACNSEPFSGC